MSESIAEDIDKICIQIREDEENFIFETIQPYCSMIAQQVLSKKDLEEAVQLWLQAKRILHTD